MPPQTPASKKFYPVGLEIDEAVKLHALYHLNQKSELVEKASQSTYTLYNTLTRV
jgi:hypothetical protein